jgi:hypothetical protein
MRTNALALAVAAFLWTGTAQAATSMGVRSCGKWVAAHSEPRGGTVDQIAVEAWLVGFLTGLAMESEKDILKDVDAPSIFLWTTNFCKANPLAGTDEAGYKLFLELSKKLRK